MRCKMIFTVLVVFWTGLIFHFSSQPAITSNEISKYTTQIIIDISPTTRSLPPKEKNTLIQKLNAKVRTYAHFILFFLFGILVYLLIRCFKLRTVYALILSLLACLLYAISDEIHQIFIPGRGCQWQDVLIDFSGSFLGVFAIYTIWLIMSFVQKSINQFCIKCIY